ncbi:MAG: (deoxy)nucleoside triphosphate pyrophosphohydrolase [Candidatus Nanopelagicales bacterium]
MAQDLHVVGAVIVREGLVLCAQRGADRDLPGLWEFPGGKIELGESPEVALEREIHEELSCTIHVGKEVTTTTHEYDFSVVTLTTFYCQVVSGTPRMSVHASLAWINPAELHTLDWSPADRPTVTHLQRTLN